MKFGFTGLTLHREQPLSRMPRVRLSTSISRLMRRHSLARRHPFRRVTARRWLMKSRRVSRYSSRSSLFINSQCISNRLSRNPYINSQFIRNRLNNSLFTSSLSRINRSLRRTSSRSTARRSSQNPLQRLSLKSRLPRLNRRSAKKR